MGVSRSRQSGSRFCPGGVYLLQAADGHSLGGKLCGDAFDQGLGTGHRCYARDVELKRGLSDRLLVVERCFPQRRVDDKSDLALPDEIGDIRAALVDLEDRLALEADLSKALRGADRRNEFKAKREESLHR